MDLFSIATPKGWKDSIRFPDAERYAAYFEKKKCDYQQPFCDYQQPYNFFTVFADFQTLPDNSGEPKSFDLKQKT